MRLYFLLLDTEQFDREIAPALSLSWKQQTFEPCRSLCRRLVGDWQQMAFDPSHLSPDETVSAGIVRGTMPFDRDVWRLLVGEVLLYSAAEIPEIETTPIALGRLLGVAGDSADRPREQFHWIEQVHYGSRDICLGGGYYRPEHAGYNTHGDVVRLANLLGGERVDDWQAEQLAGLPYLATEEEQAEELDYVQEWFPALRTLYERAAERGQIIICELL
jgi:hypothetical protein